MRVVILQQYFKRPSATSGSSRTYQMAKRIADRGHDVHIVSASAEVTSPTVEKIDNLTAHWVRGSYSHHMDFKQRIRSFLEYAVRSIPEAYRVNGDVVFASSTPLTVAIPGLAVSWLRNRPFVFEVRDLWPAVPIAMGALEKKWMRRLAEVLEWLAYRASSHVVALSPDMKDGIVSTGVPAEKVSVIPNASDNEMFEGHEQEGQEFRNSHPWLEGRKLVLYCGTMGRVNDVSYLARLAARVRSLDPEIRFLIVGAGNEEDKVRLTAQQLGVYEVNFFMLPRVPKLEVPKLFAAADLAVSTVAPISILAANSANKVFDAFASGTPVMINHRGWLADILREHDAGLVLDAVNLTKASKQLVEYLQDDEHLGTAASNAKQLAEYDFSRDRLASLLGDVLERAYQQRGALA